MIYKHNLISLKLLMKIVAKGSKNLKYWKQKHISWGDKDSASIPPVRVSKIFWSSIFRQEDVLVVFPCLGLSPGPNTLRVRSLVLCSTESIPANFGLYDLPNCPFYLFLTFGGPGGGSREGICQGSHLGLMYVRLALYHWARFLAPPELCT